LYKFVNNFWQLSPTTHAAAIASSCVGDSESNAIYWANYWSNHLGVHISYVRSNIIFMLLEQDVDTDLNCYLYKILTTEGQIGWIYTLEHLEQFIVEASEE
jgi:hypothetical protein